MTDLKQKYTEMKSERLHRFHGRRYYYNTASAGRRIIGVIKGLGDAYIVGYVTETGAHRSLKIPSLPSLPDPAGLQGLLDVWAQNRKLEEVQA